MHREDSELITKGVFAQDNGKSRKRNLLQNLPAGDCTKTSTAFGVHEMRKGFDFYSKNTDSDDTSNSSSSEGEIESGDNEYTEFTGNRLAFAEDSESDVFRTDDEEDGESTNTYSSVSSYTSSSESSSLDEESMKIIETKYEASTKNAKNKKPKKILPRKDNGKESTSLSSISI